MEVSDLFGGVDGELVDEGSDQGGAVVGVPVFRERFVVLVLVVGPLLGVFLYKPEENTSGPLFGVEIVEFLGFPGLYILRMLVILGVGCPDDSMQQHHPAAGDLLDLLRDLIVHRLP